jgi:hypothetical protein
MSVLSRLESALEAVFEGGFRRVFSPRLQPIEVARALERAMFEQKVVGPSGVEVPNFFVARLHPTDYDRFVSFRASVEKEAAAYLDRRAVEEDARLVGQIRVELQSDPSVPKSFVRADAKFEEAEETTIVTEVEQTRRFAPVKTPRPTRSLLVASEDGQQIVVDSHAIRVGRGIDNDLVLRDVRVSRHHAAIEPATDGWVVRDLQSTNGTFVDGRRIDEVSVQPGSEVSLGGYRLTLRAG